MSLSMTVKSALPAGACEFVAAVNEPVKHDYIDALRGIAFLWVFLFHFNGFLPEAPPLATDIFKRGFAGVELFYVLSAYTLSISLSSRAGESGYLFGYAIRRLFRIAPMYWLAIGAYSAYFGFGARWHLGSGVGVTDILLNAFLLHGLDPNALNGVVPGGWSVAVETQFYLLLPLLLRLSSTPRGLALTFVAAVILSFAGRPLIEAGLTAGAGVHGEVAHEFAYFSLISQLPVFLCGIGLFRISSWRRATIFHEGRIIGLSRHQASGALVLVVLAGFFPIDFTVSPLRLFPDYSGFLGYGLLSALLIYALTLHDNGFITNPVTRYFGKISYGCYLLHHLMIQYVISHFPALDGMMASLASLGLTAALASAAHRMVEEPGIVLGRRLLARLELSNRRPQQSSEASPPLKRSESSPGSAGVAVVV